MAFAVTRSCAEGTSTICGCDSHHKGPPGEGWKWGGCSEDADFGVLVSREFADARENRPDARSAMNKHNNEAGRTVSCGQPRPALPWVPSQAGLAPALPLPMAVAHPGLPGLLFSLCRAWPPPYSHPSVHPPLSQSLPAGRCVSPGVGQPHGASHGQPILCTWAACVEL